MQGNVSGAFEYECLTHIPEELRLSAIDILSIDLEIPLWNLIPLCRPCSPAVVAVLEYEMALAIHARNDSALVRRFVSDHVSHVISVVVVKHIHPARRNVDLE